MNASFPALRAIGVLRRNAGFSLCAILGLAVVLFAAPAGAEEIRYLNASRVPVRATDSASAQAQGHLLTNSRVRLLANKGEWCEIEAATPAVHGFCLCKYLSSTPLTPAQVKQQLAEPKLTPRVRLDWASKAFWLEPSLSNFVRVGTLMQDVLLTPEQKSRESGEGKVLRFKVPEFEAMKERLAQGVKPLKPGSGVQLNPFDGSEDLTLIENAKKRLALPKISASFFGNGPTLIFQADTHQDGQLDGQSMLEALANYSQQPYTVRVTAASSHDAQMDSISGIWDVGQVEAQFEQAIKLHTINAAGKAGSVEFDTIETVFPLPGMRCSQHGYTLKKRAGKADINWNEALLGWLGKPATAKAALRKRSSLGKNKFEKLEVSDIDLDGDGIADLSIWHGNYETQVMPEGYWQAVFANISGKWVLMSYIVDADCT